MRELALGKSTEGKWKNMVLGVWCGSTPGRGPASTALTITKCFHLARSISPMGAWPKCQLSPSVTFHLSSSPPGFCRDLPAVGLGWVLHTALCPPKLGVPHAQGACPS